MLVYAAVTFLKGRLAWFVRDDRASVSVDFVVAIPILLAVLVFTSEYGRVLQMRSVLDNAVADATRYLARAPRDEDSGAYPANVVDVAKQIVSQRINVNHIAVGEPVIDEVDTSATTKYDTVSLTVSIGVETPAISVISLMAYGENSPTISGTDAQGNSYDIAYRDIEGFILTATETARYFGQ